MKKIITTDDVLTLSKEGKTELVMNPGDRLTDLAREMVNRRNIRLLEASAIPAPAAPASAPTMTWSSPAAPASSRKWAAQS